MSSAISTAIPVRVDAATGMTRGGKPYFVKGAGGARSLEKLAARGANSVRTWNTAGLTEILDQAESLDLTVSVGIWLEHECSWFSYQNPEHCKKQADRVRKEVMLYRDHPALLAWGIGNEVEGDGTNVAFWKQLDRLALLVKELDPAHPTFTAVAGLSPEKAAGMNAHAPHLDYVGINTYGGASTLRKHLKKIDWKRPWMLTEWGPRGFWESPESSFGAPIEQTSSEKAEMMRKIYQNTISDEGGCLGSYVFVWGWKFEATATWFGLLTHEGETTAAIDALQEVWSATQPANRAPAIEAIRGVPKSSIAAGETFEARVQASDPENDPLVWHWLVLPEHQGKHSHTRVKMPQDVAAAIADASGNRVSVIAPEKPGVYRLYGWVKDGQGNAATANAPFEVR
ncbi:MAG: glycoside hydrolase family 2 TIM barrel-domain containing protein [Akkermansiaceae bacterium]